MQYLKAEGRMILNHLGVLMVFLVFINLNGFGDLGKILLYAGMTLCTFGFYYSAAWNIAKGERNPRSKVQSYKAKGAVFGVIHIAVICLIAWGLYSLGTHNWINVIFYGPWVTPIRFWYRYTQVIDQATAQGTGGYPVLVAAVLALIVFSSAMGYIWGLKGKSMFKDYIYPIFYKGSNKEQEK